MPRYPVPDPPWWSSGLDSVLPIQRVQVPPLVGELGRHMPCGTTKKYINKYINTVSGSIHLFHICSTSPLPFFRGTGIVLLDLTGHQLSAVVYPL